MFDLNLRNVSSIAQGKDLTEINSHSIFFIKYRQHKLSTHALAIMMLPTT